MISKLATAGVCLLLAACGDDTTATATSSSGSDVSESASSSSGSQALCPSQPGGRHVVDITMLVHAAMAVLSDGTLWCWGDGMSTVCPVVGSPRQLTDYPCLAQIDANGDHLVALTPEGDVWVTTRETKGVPRKVNDDPAKWVAQEGHLVAWGGDGAAWWWGVQPWLLNPPSDPSPFPWGPVDGLALGPRHACFWRDGVAQCVGTNEDGEIGNGATSPDPVLVPETVDIPVPVQRVVVGAFRTYAIDIDGSVWVWGSNAGFDFLPATAVPMKWADLGRATGLTSGAFADCLWRTDGETWCWGGNPLGLLVSDGTTPLPNPIPPTRRPDFEPAQFIDSDSDSPLCAIKFDGTLWCRGSYAAFAQTLPDDDVANLVPFEDP